MSQKNENIKPPRLADWLLKRFVPAHLKEELEGDLQELYAHWVRNDGVARANARYMRTVLGLIKPFSRKSLAPVDQPPSYNLGMLQNYVKIAWRSLRKQWQYSLMNIGGLAVGMACAILIFLYLLQEQSYDWHHADADRI